MIPRHLRGAIAAAVLAIGAAATSGCATDAFCLANCETAAPTSTVTRVDAGAGGLGGHMTGAGGDDCFPNCAPDAGQGGCHPSNGGIELCDGLDNDCDGDVDEGIDFASAKTCGTCTNDCHASLVNCDPASVACVAPAKPGQPGTCTCAKCAQDYHDLDGDQSCEYYCVATGGDEAHCDNRDDDCDGLKDEDVDFCTSTTDCGGCGHACDFPHATGVCQSSGPPCDAVTTHCAIAACVCNGPGDCWWNLDNSDATGCEYPCDLTNGGVEVCGDGVDNDCDGLVDAADPDVASDPQLGKPCFGGEKGECATPAHAGVTACVGVTVTCTGPDLLHPNDVLETCNGKDDDCDGQVDDAPTDAGASCGKSNIAPCALGVMKCQAGALVCVGAVDPQPETCNLVDDDCDGVIDGPTIDSGATCGKSPVAPCSLGTIQCVGGALACVGAVDPGVELCNGKDDDCNGKVDDATVDSGATCGESGTFPCALGTVTCAGGVLSCVGAVNPKPETCNGVDDDCNGQVDDATVDSGATCGKGGKFPCKLGTTTCSGGVLACVGAIDPQPELCDGVDNDCDGVIDDGAKGVGDACGASGTAPCKLGAFQCQGGALVCVGAIDPKTEVCNGVDDDCDGTVDEGALGVGDACGASATPPCALGKLACQAGALVCVGAKDPQPETCNGKDDDCDGVVDDQPTDVGGPCGKSNVFPCALGSYQCKAGALVCVGAVDPKPETCNGQDDDCDGAIDLTGNQPPADATGACSVPPSPPANVTTPCKAGAKACQGGAVVCVGAIGPKAQVDACGEDSNCDGAHAADDLTQTASCGACGNDCYAGSVHALWSCDAGACVFKGCEKGYYDLDGDKKCEYACAYLQAQEVCNGVDDNCDGKVDEGVIAPSPVQVCGVSPGAIRAECTSGVTVACTAGTWKCTFPAGVCSPSCAKATEICDGLDNDCDGVLNENVANYGKPCASDDGKPAPGDGACRTTGTFVCNGPAATKCSAVKADCATLPGGCAELCDGVDNDCDGLVDEPFSGKGSNATYFVKPAVTKISATRWIYAYEASRPSATGASAGSGNGYTCTGAACVGVPVAPGGVTLDKTPACSVQGKIPWFNVTPVEVEQTCQAMGGFVCATSDWTTACQATTPCTWGFGPRGAACTSDFVAGTKFCNLGPTYDFDAVADGDQDGLLPTASPLLKGCAADWSGLNGNDAKFPSIYDITGNLREVTRSGANVYPLMGGAFDTGDTNGASCTFSFYAVDTAFKLYDAGFRCCFSADPTL